jgi:hypothetical protein
MATAVRSFSHPGIHVCHTPSQRLVTDTDDGWDGVATVQTTQQRGLMHADAFGCLLGFQEVRHDGTNSR